MNLETNNMNKKPLLAGMDQQDIERLLVYHLLNANYKNLAPPNEIQPDLSFNSNSGFWKKIIDWGRAPMKFIQLKKFQITDWFPRTPGIYHTHGAAMAREEAQMFIKEQGNQLIYQPLGKTHMMEGGLGTFRLKPIQLNNEDYWLCTATSDGYCHTGVPVAIPNQIMNSIEINSINFYELTGEIRYLPNSLEKYYLSQNIPQIYILIERVKKISAGERKITVSPLVFFQSTSVKGFIGDNRQDFVTYVNTFAGNNEISAANEWLLNYTNTYNGKIITNYDELSHHFEDAPFSLQKVMGGTLNSNDLEKFNINNATIVCDTINNINSNQTDMSKIEITLGDGNTFNGDFVVAKSIEDSFNKLDKSNVNNELKSVLKELTSAIGSIQSNLEKQDTSNISRDLQTLTTEVTSEAPRKDWINMSLESIKKVAVKVGEIGVPIISLIGKILPLI